MSQGAPIRPRLSVRGLSASSPLSPAWPVSTPKLKPLAGFFFFPSSGAIGRPRETGEVSTGALAFPGYRGERGERHLSL
jgi:hypothetical protein